MITESLYSEKQKQILDNAIDENELIDDKLNINLNKNEILFNTYKGSVYFKNDFIGHNKLQGFHSESSKDKPPKTYLNPKKIREITRYDSKFEGTNNINSMYFMPEQHTLKGERGLFEYKKNVEYPSLSELISNLGNENKKFKNDPDEVEDFVLQIAYKDVEYIKSYKIDTSEIKGLSNFMGSWSNSNTLTKKQFENIRLLKLKSKGCLYKRDGNTFENIECSFLINHPHHTRYHLEQDGFYGDKYEESNSKTYLISEIEKYLPLEWTLKNTSQLREFTKDFGIGR